jgi:diaminopimelate epimerase
VFDGVSADVGNPHLVCVTDTPVGELDLSAPPSVDRALFPHGVNVEFVNPAGPGAIRMRVHERGVGETRSCGTGTVAAVAVALAGRPGELTVSVPGGQVRVVVSGTGDDRTATLTGPAALVAAGELDPEWWCAEGETATTPVPVGGTMGGT